MEPGPEGPGDAGVNGAQLYAGDTPQWSPAPKGRGTPASGCPWRSRHRRRNGARPRRAGGRGGTGRPSAGRRPCRNGARPRRAGGPAPFPFPRPDPFLAAMEPGPEGPGDLVEVLRPRPGRSCSRNGARPRRAGGPGTDQGDVRHRPAAMEPGPEGPGDPRSRPPRRSRTTSRNGARPRRAGGRRRGDHRPEPAPTAAMEPGPEGPGDSCSSTPANRPGHRRNGARPRRAGGTLSAAPSQRIKSPSPQWSPAPKGRGTPPAPKPPSRPPPCRNGARPRRAGGPAPRSGRCCPCAAAMEPGPEGPGDARRIVCQSAGLTMPQWSPAPKGRGTLSGWPPKDRTALGRNGARPRRAGGRTSAGRPSLS